MQEEFDLQKEVYFSISFIFIYLLIILMGLSLNSYFFDLNNKMFIKISKLATYNKKSIVIFHLFGYNLSDAICIFNLYNIN